MNYFICIGKMWDMELKMEVAAKNLKISEDQKNILVLFAEKRIDEKCNPIYRIGECEFTIVPCFDTNIPYYMQQEQDNSIN